MSGQRRRIFNKRSMDGDAENPSISRAAVRSAMQGFLSSLERKRRVPVSDDELDASTTGSLCNSTRTVGSARQPKELARGAATSKEASPPHDAVLWQQFKATTCSSFPGFRGQLTQGGNTCYMSASLQALFHLPSWERVMALVQCTCQLDTCPSCQLLNAYNQSADPQDALSLSVWKSFVTNASMRVGAQHDAEEFLKVLLNVWEVSELTSPTARQDAATFFSFFGHRLRLKVSRTPTCGCYGSSETKI